MQILIHSGRGRGCALKRARNRLLQPVEGQRLSSTRLIAISSGIDKKSPTRGRCRGIHSTRLLNLGKGSILHYTPIEKHGYLLLQPGLRRSPSDHEAHIQSRRPGSCSAPRGATLCGSASMQRPSAGGITLTRSQRLGCALCPCDWRAPHRRPFARGQSTKL